MNWKARFVIFPTKRMPVNNFRADIHCHSTFSDGTVSPQNLIAKAKEINLSGFSITDHDTMDAYREVLPLADQAGIKMISGTEFSCMHKRMSVHILGYSFQVGHPLIQAFCEKHHHRRFYRNQEILKKLGYHGMTVTQDEIDAIIPFHAESKHRIVGRPHIAQVMVQKGYVSSVAEAFRKYLGEEKPCYATGQSFSVEETIDLIHQANGLVIIAHPHLINHGKTLRDLLDMPFDGIECYYSRQHPEINKRFIKIAEKKNWLMTGGSDFHGEIKPDIFLGCSWTNEATFMVLYDQFMKNQSLA